jgi:ubiquinone/menaquinone biosynthesis C-methylase UbiE
MNLNDIQERYKSIYDKTQYGNRTGRASSFFHTALEKGLDHSHFKNVLEVGSGSGEHLQFIRHNFDKYIVSDLFMPDISTSIQVKIDDLKRQKKSIELAAENVENLTFSNSTFNRVVSTCLLHHVANPVLALQEMRRVTANDGLISIYIPSDPGMIYRLAQMIVSTRALREYFSSSEIRFLRAGEHRNHVASLSGLIHGIFENDVVSVQSFPKVNTGWNTRLFQIYSIRILKSVPDVSIGKK